MPQFFKPRRRKPSGPNKNQKKVLRGQEEANRLERAGLLGQRHPSLKSLTLRWEFISPQNVVVESQSRNLEPGSPCDLTLPCPGRCGSGIFSMTEKIASIVQARQATFENTVPCPQPAYGAGEPCGFRFHCRIDALYFPENP